MFIEIMKWCWCVYVCDNYAVLMSAYRDVKLENNYKPIKGERKGRNIILTTDHFFLEISDENKFLKAAQTLVPMASCFPFHIRFCETFRFRWQRFILFRLFRVSMYLSYPQVITFKNHITSPSTGLVFIYITSTNYNITKSFQG